MKPLIAAICGFCLALPPAPVAGAKLPAEPPAFGHPLRLTDRIETEDRTFARLLLGGRVMVLARERSSLRITEVPGATTIDVAGGRVAVTVDRENLHPEDLVQVRTPHAAASVRGHTLVVDVGAASTFEVVGGRVDVFRLDASGKAQEPATTVSGDRIVTVAPGIGPTDVASR